MHSFGLEAVTVISTTNAPAAKATNCRDDIDLQLLRNTQAYIQSLAERRVPSPRLCSAWAQFYELYYPLIHRLVQTRCIPAADTDDCAQEVWAEIVAQLARFSYDPRRGRFSCWMFALIQNKITDFLRGMTRKPGNNMRGLEASLSDRELDPAAAYEQERQRRRLRNVLATLRNRVSPTSYQVLHLRSIEGRSVGEVAARLNLTRDQVRYRHHRVKRKLRRLLEVNKVRGGEIE